MGTKYLKTFNLIGISEVKIDKVIADWDDKWLISQWGDEYTLIKYKSRNTYALKTCISEEDALNLIKKLNLVNDKSTVFEKGSTWKKERPVTVNLIDAWLERHGDPVVMETVELQLEIADKLRKIGITPNKLADVLGTTEYNATSILAGQYSLTLEDFIRIKHYIKNEH